MSVAVVIPWRGVDPHRIAAKEWVLERHASHPWPVFTGKVAFGRPWVKAEAVMPAVMAIDAEIVVVSDADVWCHGLVTAVQAVEDGASWAVPHYLIHRLTEDATDAVLGGRDPKGQPSQPEPYGGMVGGGIVIARRETLLEIPLDPRFTGWGEEDRCWGLALRKLLGKPKRGTADLYHLWHPPMPGAGRQEGSDDAVQLRRRYTKAARGHEPPETMRELLQEAKSGETAPA